MEQIVDRFYRVIEFEVLLEDARMSVSNDWEEKFVTEFISNFEKYGIKMMISEKQIKMLKKIARYED